MQKIYRIKLSPEERAALISLTTSSKRISAKKVIKAQALLLADESEAGQANTDAQIMQATGMKPATLVRLRQRVCEVGPIEALERKPQASLSRKKIVDGEVEAQLTRIACSRAPDGRKRWTLRLLADKLVELEVVAAISHETVRSSMKKNTSNRG
jgi:tryptophan 2,3-dioxygenase